MEKVIWKGTFAEAEERDDKYWASQTEQFRLATLIEIREILLDSGNARMEKVAIKRKLSENE